ncbi:hypothetical protein B0T16DRAFT_68490 [Cercophora newfieldiana]|uniref:Uncharacterized protein n=1 Tax=Cercophora newfieldiana TaxID=92897 RepID=A0AA39YSC5_9PEZI|nr:hypothetical protein B0T16DRAFT_68490 [Cercophora newfieldiana]
MLPEPQLIGTWHLAGSLTFSAFSGPSWFGRKAHTRKGKYCPLVCAVQRRMSRTLATTRSLTADSGQTTLRQARTSGMTKRSSIASCLGRYYQQEHRATLGQERIEMWTARIKTSATPDKTVSIHHHSSNTHTQTIFPLSYFISYFGIFSAFRLHFSSIQQKTHSQNHLRSIPQAFQDAVQRPQLCYIPHRRPRLGSDGRACRDAE